jgi:dTDP-4-dehydrorhamnose reductase
LRCLIVGADGSFGGALSGELRARGHSVAVTTRRRDRATPEGAMFLDLADAIPRLPGADVAVICAAMARFEDCRRFPELAHRVNVLAPLELARTLTRAGTRVILLSTSAVFDCRKPHMGETEAPAPRSAYGRLKAEAETRLLDLGGLVSVLRLTKVVKPGVGILSQWIRLFGQGKTVQAFDDHSFCPLPVGAVVDAISILVDQGQSGIYHVSGAADISFAEAARYLAAQVGVPSVRVDAVHGNGNGIASEDLTPFTSLATERLSELSAFIPPNPQDVLQDVYSAEIHAARNMLAPGAG